jgi:threonine synthase
MKYISTRGGAQPAAFCDILLEGLQPDGGLAMPESYPKVGAQQVRLGGRSIGVGGQGTVVRQTVGKSRLAQWRPLGYRELAFEILKLYIDDIPEADLKDIVDRTYTVETFGSADITPVKTLEPGLHLLQLSNGPTLAFKDVAMQLLGNLFEYVLKKRGQTLNILGATSGDTGSAAEYAMRGKQGVRVFMLSPFGKMSPFQQAQMYSLQDPNIHNIAIKGVFDDCQDIVKAVSNDLEFKQRYNIGTVNSINWARLLAQVVYYFKGYFAVTKTDDEQVSFAVPSGNFGNVCAGHVARMMGLPIRKLIVATNENDVLDEFFRTGVYRVRKGADVFQTSSPSMDISKASNFERFIYDLVGRDPKIVSELWQQIDKQGFFDLNKTPYFAKIKDFGFVSGSSNHAHRLDTIRKIDNQYGYIIDTHTADGVKVGLEHREQGVQLLCLETALAVKFEGAIKEALGRAPQRPAGYENIETLPQRCEVMDRDVGAVKGFIENGAA